MWSLLCNVKRLACGRHLRGRERGRALNESILQGQKPRISQDCCWNTHKSAMAHFFRERDLDMLEYDQIMIYEIWDFRARLWSVTCWASRLLWSQADGMSCCPSFISVSSETELTLSLSLSHKVYWFSFVITLMSAKTYSGKVLIICF